MCMYMKKRNKHKEIDAGTVGIIILAVAVILVLGWIIAIVGVSDRAAMEKCQAKGFSEAVCSHSIQR
jgi:Tfp pilus assembly protein PilO